MEEDGTFGLNVRLGEDLGELGRKGNWLLSLSLLPLGLVCFNRHCPPRDSSLSPADAQLLESCF